jgi:hypothetical protein
MKPRTLEENQALSAALAKVTVTVKSMAEIPGSSKCQQRGHWHTIQRNYDDLCDRCCKVLVNDFPDHPSVPHIKHALKQWTH